MFSLAAVACFAALLLLPLQAARQDGTCRFPSRWEGTWFQSGVRQPITIEPHRLSSKGHCIAAEGDKFVVVDDKGACFRCVVIHEKHANVLQYKETFCHGRAALSSLCALITGDALLYSMFRVGGRAVACPFAGAFAFTYNRGHGDCRHPVSTIDACTEPSRLLLRYQACPDVHGTESTVEELQCLATWKEGSSRYLVGKVHHGHATSDEDRYRCFVYERADDAADFRVAQSGDATCNGLSSPLEGSRTMTLRKALPKQSCAFPAWLSAWPQWHTLDYRRSYSLTHHNTTLRITNATTLLPPPPQPPHGYGPVVQLGLTQAPNNSHETRVVCSEAWQGPGPGDSAMIVAHFTMGCHSGYMCMLFYRRDGHVIELQTGSATRRPEDACQPMHFNRSSLPFVTLVTSAPEPRTCPYVGEFSVTGWRHDASAACDAFTSLAAGCSSGDTLEFRSLCDSVSAYSCHGRWEDNGTHYLITTPLSRASHGARRLCFMYREQEGVLRLSTSPDSCLRGVDPGVGGLLAFNATAAGKCSKETNSAYCAECWQPWLLIGIVVSLVHMHRFNYMVYSVER